MAAELLPGDAFEADGDGSGDDGGHVWEQPMERTWDELEEDESGRLKSRRLERQRVRKARLDGGADLAGRVVERGMIRYLYLVVDFSRAMRETDFRPSRRAVAVDYVGQFVHEFFGQNPISQLGVIVCYDGKAQTLTHLSGNPREQTRVLSSFERVGGDLSLQNGLEHALDSLEQIPLYGSREVLVVMGSLSSCDPGDIYQSLDRLRAARVRVSFVSLAAEMHVSRHIANETSGTYAVATKASHMRELLFRHVVPLPTPESHRGGELRRWVRMGFPQKFTETHPSMCACHKRFVYSGFRCPKCSAKCCELPTECRVCGLMLISSPHLARSYHHLFSVAPYAEASAADVEAAAAFDGTAGGGPGEARCFACQLVVRVGDALITQCGTCARLFCADCDVFVHETLHNCPGCEARPMLQAAAPPAT